MIELYIKSIVWILILKLTLNVESLELRTDFWLKTPFIQTFEALFYSKDFPAHHKLYLQTYQIILVLEDFRKKILLILSTKNMLT